MQILHKNYSNNCSRNENNFFQDICIDHGLLIRESHKIIKWVDFNTQQSFSTFVFSEEISVHCADTH